MLLVVQPLGRSPVKTDRRDAHALSELLWINRERLLRGDRVHGVRTVHQHSAEQQADRLLTRLRERLVWRRTQTLNQIHKILRRRNLEWERPTKTFQTRKVIEWLKTLAQLLATMPGVNTYIALAIVCRIAPVERFPHGQFPGDRNSGNSWHHAKTQSP